MQSTIDYMFSIDPNCLKELEQLGEPKLKEITSSTGETIKYYVFKHN